MKRANSYPTDIDEEMSPEALAAEVDFEARLAEIQKRQQEEIQKHRLEQLKVAQPPVVPYASRSDGQRCPMPITDNPTQRIMNAIEEHHRAVGAFLKFAEAAITDLRCTTYLNDREVTKAHDNINKAIQDARPVLDRRRTGSLGGRPGGDAYYGPELDALHKLTYAINTQSQIFKEDCRATRKAISQTRSIEPFLRERERQQMIELSNARLELSPAVKDELNAMIGAVVNTARRQPQLFAGAQPVALPLVAPLTITERHAELRKALIENPDRPQAFFVARFQVHPRMVKRCRRELEEAGVIPVLTHRLRPASRRPMAAD